MPLTRRQKWRIEKVQSERIARANKAAIENEKNITNEEVPQKGRVITRYGQRQLVESSTSSILLTMMLMGRFEFSAKIR